MISYPSSEPKEGIEISIEEWAEFKRGKIWAAFQYEIMQRRDYLVDLFIDHDQLWSDNEIRARINELGFMVQIPDSLIAEQQDSVNKQKENSDG